MFFRIHAFQGSGFLGSRFFRVQVYQGPGFSGNRFFRVQDQGPGFRSSPENVNETEKSKKLLVRDFNSK